VSKIEIDVPGEFSAIEEAVLQFLYSHPDGEYGTFHLARQLKPEPPAGATEEQKLQAFKDVQNAIETLIMAKLAKGRRLRAASGEVYFEELKLTTTGEAEAIKQKRAVKKLVITTNVELPKREGGSET